MGSALTGYSFANNSISALNNFGNHYEAPRKKLKKFIKPTKNDYFSSLD
jgi:hypothetical protein